VSTNSELARLQRDIDSLAEEIAVNTGAKSKSPMSAGEKRSLKAALQRMIQQLDELSSKLSG
jgi:hypothetical protein